MLASPSPIVALRRPAPGSVARWTMDEARLTAARRNRPRSLGVRGSDDWRVGMLRRRPAALARTAKARRDLLQIEVNPSISRSARAKPGHPRIFARCLPAEHLGLEHAHLYFFPVLSPMRPACPLLPRPAALALAASAMPAASCFGRSDRENPPISSLLWSPPDPVGELARFRRWPSRLFFATTPPRPPPDLQSPTLPHLNVPLGSAGG